MNLKKCDIDIPGINIGDYIGGGANGSVFVGLDNLLGRKIAIKVWNSKGEKRAQAEISKIAKIQHELFVSTYQFGFQNGKPFAIMEFIDGKNGKEWLKENPEFDEKVHVWESYSKGLKLLYEKNEFHGDPHLGNVLIDSKNGIASKKMVVKLADTGTSVFWESHKEFVKRDVELIIETANKMFKADNISSLIEIPNYFSPQKTLEVIDRFCELIQFIRNQSVDIDVLRSSNIAAHISKILVTVPLFNLDEIIKLCVAKGITGSPKIIIYLNRSLEDVNNAFHSSEVSIEEIKREYINRRNLFESENRFNLPIST